MTTITPEAAAKLGDWAADVAPHWYDTKPTTAYTRSVGMLPDPADLSSGLVEALLASLKVRAMYRIHDDALIALRVDPDDGALAIYPRSRLAEILRSVLAALPPVPPTDDRDDDFPDAVARLRRTLPDAYIREALDYALDRRATADPVDEETELVRLTPRPLRNKRRTASELQREHLAIFLGSVPVGTHRTTEVFDEYTRAAARSGVRPLGRSKFYAAADLELGPRVRWARGEVYRVLPTEIEPSDFRPADAIGFTPAPLTTATRDVLTRALARRRTTPKDDPFTHRKDNTLILDLHHEDLPVVPNELREHPRVQLYFQLLNDEAPGLDLTWDRAIAIGFLVSETRAGRLDEHRALAAQTFDADEFDTLIAAALAVLAPISLATRV